MALEIWGSAFSAKLIASALPNGFQLKHLVYSIFESIIVSWLNNDIGGQNQGSVMNQFERRITNEEIGR